MKIKLSMLLAFIAWGAVLTQFYLMMENKVASYSETTIRFFSFFTILTNILVAMYFTLSPFEQKKGIWVIVHKPGTLTAVTVYISIVGFVYQILLRHIWEPQGTQMVVDELLHSIIPILVIIFWYVFEKKALVTYSQIPGWLIFPLGYLIFILIRGHLGHFYPYPFVDVTHLGIYQVLVNSAGLILLFIAVSALFIKMGAYIKNS